MPGEEPQMRYEHVAVRLLHYILVFGGAQFKIEDEQLFHREIWVFNMFIEQWRKYVVPLEKSVPPVTARASATVIKSDIYMFGGEHIWTGMQRNDLWKLNRTPEGCCSWNQIEFQSKAKTPSPRAGHNEWEHAEKLWIFGGFGDLPDGYLHDHGDFDEYHNNQLLCFDPVSWEWANPTCFGYIPPPALDHAATRIGDSLWLFGGFSYTMGDWYDDCINLICLPLLGL